MGFGASLPADGQRQKAGATSAKPASTLRASPCATPGDREPACAPSPHACHRATASLLAPRPRAPIPYTTPKTKLHNFFRFARSQSPNQTITASHLAFPIESPSSANRHVRHTHERPRKTGKFVHGKETAGSMESNSQGALLCLTTKRKVGWLKATIRPDVLWSQ